VSCFMVKSSGHEFSHLLLDAGTHYVIGGWAACVLIAVVVVAIVCVSVVFVSLSLFPV